MLRIISLYISTTSFCISIQHTSSLHQLSSSFFQNLQKNASLQLQVNSLNSLFRHNTSSSPDSSENQASRFSINQCNAVFAYNFFPFLQLFLAYQPHDASLLQTTIMPSSISFIQFHALFLIINGTPHIGLHLYQCFSNNIKISVYYIHASNSSSATIFTQSFGFITSYNNIFFFQYSQHLAILSQNNNILFHNSYAWSIQQYNLSIRLTQQFAIIIKLYYNHLSPQDSPELIYPDASKKTPAFFLQYTLKIPFDFFLTLNFSLSRFPQITISISSHSPYSHHSQIHTNLYYDDNFTHLKQDTLQIINIIENHQTQTQDDMKQELDKWTILFKTHNTDLSGKKLLTEDNELDTTEFKKIYHIFMLLYHADKIPNPTKDQEETAKMITAYGSKPNELTDIQKKTLINAWKAVMSSTMPST